MTIDTGVEIREIAGRDVLSLRRELAEIWPDASRARIDEILPRHVSRDGFRFLGAFAERCLAPGHFEFTELHVRREFRRRGIGGSLHDALLEGVDAPTAVLSTQTDNEPAISLYAGRGWQVIVPYLDFGSGRPFLIMGLVLR